MVRIHQPTLEDETKYKAWLSNIPSRFRKIAEQFDPWSVYRMKSTRHLVMLYGFDETEYGIMLIVLFLKDFNPFVPFNRNVFEVNPNDLEPCELPESNL